MKDKSLSQDYLRSILEYFPETGEFFWKDRGMFATKNHSSKTWNTRYAGKKAGRVMKNGYASICIDGQVYGAHRLAWIYVNGNTKYQIDHKNMNPIDNRISNLRESTQSQNRFNTRKNSRNTSGYKGVCYNKASKKWQVSTFLNSKPIYVGLFNCPTAAHFAYIKYIKENHGEFARLT